MSVVWVRAVFEHSKARRAARLVLLSLAERANDDGTCWPSIADTAKRAMVSDRAAQMATRALVQLGELRIERRGGGRSAIGKGYSNLYRITLPNGEPPCAVAGHCPAPPDEATAHESIPKVNTGSDLPRTPVRPYGERPCAQTNSEPVLNHQSEPSVSKPDLRGSNADTAERPEEERQAATALDDRMRSGPTRLSQIIVSNTEKKAVQPAAKANPEVLRIMADRGCDDVGFRVVVARMVDPRIVRAVARDYDQQRDRIKNAGGWWRDQLRRHGATGI